MIDASGGFIKDGPKNRLRAQDVHKIVDVFTRRLDMPRYSRMVSVEEIEKNDLNLNLPRYIDSQVPEDRQDIEGHLKGGIPVADIDALQEYWTVCPQLRKALFKNRRAEYFDLSVPKATIKSAIYEHPEFSAFKGWTCDLIPKTLIVAHFYAKDQAVIDKLAADLESTSAKIAELEEEHGGEEGVFSELDKVNRANVAARLKEIRGDKAAKDEAANFIRSRGRAPYGADASCPMGPLTRVRRWASINSSMSRRRYSTREPILT